MSIQSIGKYKIINRLGQGGMAEVYEAHDPLLDRRVAIKVIHAHLGQGQHFAERFQREARLIAALRHPNIVQVYDFDIIDAKPFMVMEYLGGGTLQARLAELRRQRKTMLQIEVARILDRLASALDYAHARGLVHRDIKPANILFDERSQPVLADFGIAKIFSGGEQFTAVGSILGTPAYLSPEQATGSPVSPASDLYSLGVVAYEMVTGRAPFQADSVSAILAMHVNLPPQPPRHFNPELPESLQATILRALAKEPAARFGTAGEFASAFQAGLSGGAVTTLSLSAQAPTLPGMLDETDRTEPDLVEPTPIAALPVQAGAPPSSRRTPPIGLSGFPAQLTPFVGRSLELEEVTRLLEDQTCRLLTLTGHGGIGKSRLAIQAAARLLGGSSGIFFHGVRFVPLAGLDSAEFLVPTIASALRLSLYSAEDPKKQLLDYLSEKRILLVLDNFENLLSGAGADEGLNLVTDILESASGIKILVSSRSRLNILGEWVLELGGLDVPGQDAQDLFEEFSSVQLFLQGARRAAPGFVVSEEDKQAIVKICQLLNGMPLGIELASVWVRTLSCAEILTEIQGNLDFLQTTQRNVPERQRSLRAVFEYSWKQLTLPEQAVFEKLSVFQGGFSREAAASVCQASLSILATLVERSLLIRDNSGRYAIHGVLLQYARKKLRARSGEIDLAISQHIAYFAAYADRRVSSLRGQGQLQALREIDSEIDNLRSAWSWALERCQLEAIDQFIDAWFHYYEIRSFITEGEESFLRAASICCQLTDENTGKPGVQRILARSRLRAANFTWQLGKIEQARQDIEQSLLQLRQLDEKPEIALARYIMGRIANRQLEFNQAQAHFLESAAIYEDVGDSWGIASALVGLGYAAVYLGQYEEGRDLYGHALEISRRSGDQLGIADCSRLLAGIATLQGQYDEARHFHLECLAIFEAFSNWRGMASSLNNLADDSFYVGAYQECIQYYRRSLAINEDIGDSWGTAYVLYGMGEAQYELAEYPQATESLRMSVRVFKKINYDSGVIAGLTGLAKVARATQQYRESTQLLHQALSAALRIQSTPLALQAVSETAALLSAQGDLDGAAALASMVVCHPESASDVQTDSLQQAKSLLAELEGRLSAADFSRFTARAQELDFDAVLSIYLADVDQQLIA